MIDTALRARVADTPSDVRKNESPARPGFRWSNGGRRDHRCLMISSANSLHFTSVAPSIRRAKS